MKQLWNRFGAGIFAVLLPMLWVLGAPPAVALPVAGLYSYEVAVENQSDAERNRAFREALEAVFVKVSGDRRWLENSRLQETLSGAQRYVAGISYRSERLPAVSVPVEAGVKAPGVGNPPDAALGGGSPPAVAPREQNYLNVEFSRELIDQLLTDAGVPVWDANRPGILVWLAIQDASGERRFMSPEVDPEIVEIMQEFSRRRGVPIIFPLLDFEDRRNLSPDTVWNLDEQAISRASARYGADSVLAGRVLFAPSGELVGLWKFLFQNNVTLVDSVDTELANYINVPLSRATEQLANHFATVRNSAQRQVVRLHVEGVSSLGDYAALVDYLRSLGLVNRVSTILVDGDRLELEVDVIGSGGQLNELILLDRDLLPVMSAANSDRPGMHYRWTR